MKKTALLIMAAGIGSRYGVGIKQLEPMGLKDEIIMDYSIHDAIEAGFNKIIIVIRRDIESDFKERIGNRIQSVCEKHGIEIEYCFQQLDEIPVPVPEGRTKPWGTGHAVLAAKELISEPFCVINADDYYGKAAFRQLHDWLILDHDRKAVSMAGFILKNTLSDNGGVTRGVCVMKEGHTHICNVVETHNIIKTPNGPMAGDQALDPECYVSMNMWGFPANDGETPYFLEVLEERFLQFFEKDAKENPLKSEYLLPTLIGQLLQEGETTVKVLETNDKWFGVTYQEDKPEVVASIHRMIENGVYAADLYADL